MASQHNSDVFTLNYFLEFSDKQQLGGCGRPRQQALPVIFLHSMASITQLPSPIPVPGEPVGELGLPVILRLSDSRSGSYKGKIRRVEKGFFQLSSTVRMEPNLRLEILMDGCTIMTEVVSCEEHKAGDFRLGARRFYGPQRAIRSEPRIPVNFDAVVKTSASESISGRVVDMSHSGLGMELSTAVPAGTRVFVEFVSGTAFGEIKHCSSHALTFRAGVRIDEFVVRKRSSADPPSFAPPTNAAFSAHIAARSRSLVLKAICSVAGHKYLWCDDAWERPVLRCGRCHQDLDASTR